MWGEWNETIRTCRDPFGTKKFSNLGPEILVEWIAPQNSTRKHTKREEKVKLDNEAHRDARQNVKLDSC